MPRTRLARTKLEYRMNRRRVSVNSTAGLYKSERGTSEEKKNSVRPHLLTQLRFNLEICVCFFSFGQFIWCVASSGDYDKTFVSLIQLRFFASFISSLVVVYWVPCLEKCCANQKHFVDVTTKRDAEKKWTHDAVQIDFWSNESENDAK